MTQRQWFGHAASFDRWALTLVGLLVTAVAGCGIRPGSSAAPTTTPPATPPAIEHPTGATDLILRLDEGGGFVPPSFFVTEGPPFSLYGDGTAIFRDPSTSPQVADSGVAREVPYQTVRLTEPEVQALLAAALGPGALGTARESYVLPIADAPTTTFTIVADGLTRHVRINGLGLGADAGVSAADAAVLSALERLRAELLGFSATASGEVTWLPQRYRAFLIEPFPAGERPGRVRPWPWTTISPADFVTPSDQDLPHWPMRVLTRDEVAALGLDGLEGGVRGILLAGPGPGAEAPTFELALRPLLPDEPR